MVSALFVFLFVFSIIPSNLFKMESRISEKSTKRIDTLDFIRNFRRYCWIQVNMNENIMCQYHRPPTTFGLSVQLQHQRTGKVKLQYGQCTTVNFSSLSKRDSEFRRYSASLTALAVTGAKLKFDRVRKYRLGNTASLS